MTRITFHPIFSKAFHSRALQKYHYAVWCHTADIGISNKVEYLGKEASYNYSTKEIV